MARLGAATMVHHVVYVRTTNGRTRWTTLSLPLPPSLVLCFLLLILRQPRHHRVATAGYRSGSGLAASGIESGLAGLSALSSRSRIHLRCCCFHSPYRRPWLTLTALLCPKNPLACFSCAVAEPRVLSVPLVCTYPIYLSAKPLFRSER